MAAVNQISKQHVAVFSDVTHFIGNCRRKQCIRAALVWRTCRPFGRIRVPVRRVVRRWILRERRGYCQAEDWLEWVMRHCADVAVGRTGTSSVQLTSSTYSKHTEQFINQPFIVPSVLWRCWLGGSKGVQPVKTEWWGTGMVICLERGANDLHMVQVMPLPPQHLLLQ